MKLHKGVGHPRLPDFIRFLKTVIVKGEVIRWAAKEFKCPACEANPKPKPSRLATIPKRYQQKWMDSKVQEINFRFQLLTT